MEQLMPHDAQVIVGAKIDHAWPDGQASEKISIDAFLEFRLEELVGVRHAQK
jgi:hypothetical protein